MSGWCLAFPQWRKCHRVPFCRWTERSPVRFRALSKVTKAGRPGQEHCHQPWGSGRGPPPPRNSSPFFPLLFMLSLGPQPAWLPPAISPYHCSGSQPGGPLETKSPGPLVQGRWGCPHGVAGARLSWSGLFSFLPAASGDLGVAEWAGVAAPSAHRRWHGLQGFQGPVLRSGPGKGASGQ